MSDSQWELLSISISAVSIAYIIYTLGYVAGLRKAKTFFRRLR